MLTRLPHRVSLMTESRVTFVGGAYTSTWTSLGFEWGNFQRVSANESTAQDKKQQYTKWIGIMRSNANVTNKCRIDFNGLILHIESVSDPTARGRMIEVVCREEVK